MGIENRGFASMDPVRRREIASRGGRTAHMVGKAHRWTPEEAREAARKGREVVAARIAARRGAAAGSGGDTALEA